MNILNTEKVIEVLERQSKFDMSVYAQIGEREQTLGQARIDCKTVCCLAGLVTIYFGPDDATLVDEDPDVPGGFTLPESYADNFVADAILLNDGKIVKMSVFAAEFMGLSSTRPIGNIDDENVYASAGIFWRTCLILPQIIDHLKRWVEVAKRHPELNT